MEALSAAMRWELAPLGVRVSIIEPGPVRTAFVDHVIGSANAVSSASLYAPALGDFAKLQRLAERTMITPEVVVRDIVHAASSERPRTRYVAPRLLAHRPDVRPRSTASPPPHTGTRMKEPFDDRTSAVKAMRAGVTVCLPVNPIEYLGPYQSAAHSDGERRRPSVIGARSRAGSRSQR